MANNDSPDYKAILLQERELHQRERELHQRERELHQRERERDKELLLQERERNRRTTFKEFIRHCHTLLSKPLKVATPSSSTTGTIPLPKGKHCPTRLRPWTDCVSEQQTIYSSVCNHLQSTVTDSEETPSQLFSPIIALEDLARRFGLRPISSEQGVETYERIAIEDHVRDIISELCKIPAAQEEFMLGDGVWFENHANALDEAEFESDLAQQPTLRRPRPDQFCIYRVNGDTNSLLLTVEYKPPHKLSVETLRAGLRPMELWEEMVQRETIPTDPTEKLQYNAERLATSAIVQTYDVMIEEGRSDAILTNGLARVLLHVPYDDPATLLYHLCDPNREIGEEDWQSLQQPKTSVARELCQCLRSFRSPTRDQEWRNSARSQLHIWKTGFDHTRSLIPKEELQKTPPSGMTNSSSDPSHSEYQPSSSPPESPTPQGRRDAEFCTQRCLFGLQTGDILDQHCPNIKYHRGQNNSTKHPISADDLVRLLKSQLDENIDRCIPLGGCGSYGAPFKLTCIEYGYTMIGKGTTSKLWNEVSREAQVYQILRKAQASAVPVFLGTIDLAKIYFLHGAGQIRHMLVMGWGGESTAKMELTKQLRREIRKSNKEIEALGIIHEDLRQENVLWCEELKRALIIDFHRSTLRRRSFKERSSVAKRPSRPCQVETGESDVKRLRIS